MNLHLSFLLLPFSCLLLLIEKDETRLQYNSKLISRTIPEIVMCFQSSGKKSKDDVALNLLLKIGNIYQVYHLLLTVHIALFAYTRVFVTAIEQIS